MSRVTRRSASCHMSNQYCMDRHQFVGVQTHMHTCTRAHVHTCTRAHTHTRARAQTQTQIHYTSIDTQTAKSILVSKSKSLCKTPKSLLDLGVREVLTQPPLFVIVTLPLMLCTTTWATGNPSSKRYSRKEIQIFWTNSTQLTNNSRIFHVNQK